MSTKQNIVVFTGAGISAESGIQTFRDANGLWEGHDVLEVASPEGFRKNPALVLDFYNQRRKQARAVNPNPGHLALVELEKHFPVQIITQNVDNLHEKAGSSNVLHLHGELFKMRSTKNPHTYYDMDKDEIHVGDLAPDGSQLRPHIVWFGEDVPMFPRAVEIAQSADILIIIGTSLVVYPANTLLEFAPRETKIHLIDPKRPAEDFGRKIEYLLKPASVGVPELVERLIKMNP